MSQIFDSEIIKKEFEEFYRVVIPNLNNCKSCGILKCSKCFVFQYNRVMCCIFRCKNFQLFKTSRDFLFQKTSIEQYNYIVNFVRDLYHVSDHSIMRYKDLKPISAEVKKTRVNFFYNTNILQIGEGIGKNNYCVFFPLFLENA